MKLDGTWGDVGGGVDIGGVDFIGSGLNGQCHLNTSFPPKNMRETIGLHGLEALVEEKGVKNILAGRIFLDDSLEISLGYIR